MSRSSRGAEATISQRDTGMAATRRRWWLVFLLVPFGWGAWGCFVYAGAMTGNRRWLAAAAAYLALAVTTMLIVGLGGAQTDDPGHDPIVGIGTLGSVLLWIGAAAHALEIRDELDRRLDARDPAVDEALAREAARDLAASRPAMAQAIGVGRPDRPGAEHAGLVDVNAVPVEALAELPGIDPATAGRIEELRPFASVEDLGAVLELSPALVEELREATIFIARPRGGRPRG